MPSSELPEKIRAWLETQGYPLEMRVSRAFQEAGFRVIQSDYYPDEETEEPREIDVIASHQERIGRILFRVNFVIECKSSSNKPWVLFTSKSRLAAPARVLQRAGNYLAQAFLHEVAHDKEIQSLPIFKIPIRPAYGFTQAFSSNVDICYSAAMSVASAATGRSFRYDTPPHSHSIPDLLELAFPIIVTEAPLFAAFLEKDSSISLNQQNSGVLLWRKQMVGMPHTIIHIINESHLESFVSEAAISARLLIDLCKGRIRDKLDAAQERFKSLA